MNWKEARIAAQRVCLGWSPELRASSRWEELLRDATPERMPAIVEELRAADSYLRALEVVADVDQLGEDGPARRDRTEWGRAVDVMADAWIALPEELSRAVTAEAERRGWIPRGTAKNRADAAANLAAARFKRR